METNIIYNEDCLEGMKKLPDKSIDMILADLPYGTTACSWDSIIPLEPLWEQYKRTIKDNGAIVLTASQPFTTKLISSNMDWFKYCWYWNKERGTDFTSANKQPMKRIEEICVFYKNAPLYKSKGEKLDKPYKHALPISRSGSNFLNSDENYNLKENGERKYRTYTHKKKDNLLKFSRDNAGRGLHPTQKPVALFEYLIKTYTNESEVVLDNVIGSGTTAVAALKSNRKFIGFEKETKYYNIALKRIGKFDKKYYEELPEEEKPEQNRLV